jgi:hypothetical protein
LGGRDIATIFAKIQTQYACTKRYPKQGSTLIESDGPQRSESKKAVDAGLAALAGPQRASNDSATATRIDYAPIMVTPKLNLLSKVAVVCTFTGVGAFVTCIPFDLSDELSQVVAVLIVTLMGLGLLTSAIAMRRRATRHLVVRVSFGCSLLFWIFYLFSFFAIG